MRMLLPTTLSILLASTAICNADHTRVPRFGSSLVSLEAVSHGGHFVRHTRFRGVLHPRRAHDTKFEQDSQFAMRPGLAGVGVSFEAINYPGCYLKHENFAIVLRRDNGTRLFSEDASFLPREGLAGRGTSFESLNYEGCFLRHRNYQLCVARYNGSFRFAYDASFNIVRCGSPQHVRSDARYRGDYSGLPHGRRSRHPSNRDLVGPASLRAHRDHSHYIY